MPNTNYAAVLFDLDGTLLNTLADLADSMNAALARFNYPQHPTDDYRFFVGRGAAILAHQAAGADAPEADVAAILAEYRGIYENLAETQTRPYDGIAELLEYLQRRNIAVGVLSNKPHTHTVATVARHFPDYPFARVIGQREGVPIKPDPVGALEFAAAVNLAAQRVVYVGDTGVDMQTATRAGMFAVGAKWGFRTAEELTEGGAKLLIDDPRELFALFA
ncbi:MAG: HAD family hydrolase [Oscillospiraceae bacterium]|nr:HAD family hydrolase [Oscillospiraceae bacterium]